MPIREFECQSCRHRFEEILGINETNPVVCPKCGATGLKQLLSTFRVTGLSKKSDTAEAAGEGDLAEEASGGGFDDGLGGMDEAGDAGLGMEDGGMEGADNAVGGDSEEPSGNINTDKEV